MLFHYLLNFGCIGPSGKRGDTQLFHILGDHVVGSFVCLTYLPCLLAATHTQWLTAFLPWTSVCVFFFSLFVGRPPHYNFPIQIGQGLNQQNSNICRIVDTWFFPFFFLYREWLKHFVKDTQRVKVSGRRPWTMFSSRSSFLFKYPQRIRSHDILGLFFFLQDDQEKVKDFWEDYVSCFLFVFRSR